MNYIQQSTRRSKIVATATVVVGLVQPAFAPAPVISRPFLRPATAGLAIITRTPLPAATTAITATAATIETVCAALLPRRPGRIVSFHAPIPPVTTPTSAALARADVIHAPAARTVATPRPVVLATHTADPNARPHVPRVTPAAWRRFAAVVAFTRTTAPPEAVRSESTSAPHMVRAAAKPAPAGRITATHTISAAGRLGQPTACEPAIVKAAVARPRAGRVTVVGSPGRSITPPVAGVVVGVRSPRRAGLVALAHTATPPAPPSRVPVTMRASTPPRRAGRVGPAVHALAFTVHPAPTPHAIAAGKARPRTAPRPLKVGTAQAAATALQPARVVPVLVKPGVLARRPGRAVRTVLPAGPTPIARPFIVARGRARPSASPAPVVATTRTAFLIEPSKALIARAGVLPKRAGRVTFDQTWIASPVQHGPIPRALIVPPGQWPKRCAPPPLITANPIAWNVTGLAPDLPAAVIAWLRLNPAIVAAFGETLTTTPPVYKLFGDWNSTKAPMPYLVYQEVFEGPGNYQSPDSTGTVYGFPTGQFQISIFAAGKRLGRDLARMVARALGDAPLTFADGVLLELRLDSTHALPEGDIGPGGVVTAYHFALTFLYRVQRTLN